MSEGRTRVKTKKLYYQDPYIQTFTAQIVEQNQDEKGHYVVLDKTAFYPTGGGQPHDTGQLNGVQVVDVEEVEEEVRHYIEETLDVKECTGEINWKRRFDHMQQHAGQHIVTAAFEEMFGYKTVSFHLGKEMCAIDLDIPTLTEEEAKQVEERANEVILENHPIETRWVTEEELRDLPLRKALAVSENIRLVVIPNFDYNGCGGTHPNSTGQVSAITILHWEKQKKQTRVYFICGNRVRQQLHEKHEVIQRLNSLFSAPQEQLEVASTRVFEQQKALEKEIAELKSELLQVELEKAIEQSIDWSGHRLVKQIYQQRPMQELQQLAKSITQKSDNVVVFLISETEEKLQVVCARSEDVSLNMKEFMKSILPLINGKGGGSETMAQGGGEKLLSPEALLESMLLKG